MKKEAGFKTLRNFKKRLKQALPLSDPTPNLHDYVLHEQKVTKLVFVLVLYCFIYLVKILKRKTTQLVVLA